MKVKNIIQDIENNNYYNFTIKPLDEDEQIYYAPKKINGDWNILAHCFYGKIKTKNLIKRLSNRLDAEVIILI